MVYRAEDTASGSEVALKVLPRQRGVANLRSEFLALSKLRHDNIVQVFDYGLTDSGDDFFTMELVEGPSLAESAGGPDAPTFAPLIAGILRGLAFVHAGGMVHADLKPSNLLVHGSRLASAPSAAVVLADFGLAAIVADPTSSAARGTFPYAAPEAYAARIDPRSDLYSFGVILFELIAGRPPFDARDLATVLAEQRRGPPPAAALSAAPPELASLVIALLDPAPGARPQTADEVLSRLGGITGAALGAAAAPPVVDPGAVLVGRDAELARLTEAWDATETEGGRAVAVLGDAGAGKSRLVDELVVAVQLRGGDALRLDAEDDTLGVEVDASSLDRESRFAVAEAVARSLAVDRPTLFVIDHVERAPARAEEVAAYLARAAATQPALYVLAGRRDADATRRLAETIERSEGGGRLELGPLGAGDVDALVAGTLSPAVAAAVAPALYRQSGGNPGVCARALEVLVERGAIARERGAWIVTEDPIDIPLAADAAERARQRLARCSGETRALAPLLGCLGERFARGLATAVASELAGDDDTFDRAAAELAAAHVVLADVATGDFHWSPPALAAALADELTATRRDALHRAVVGVLERERDAGRRGDDEALARHALALGDLPAGIAAARRAASERAARLDQRGAVGWLERVWPLLPAAEATRVREELGDLRVVVGEVDQAGADYQAALDAATEPAARSRILCRLAELHRRQGDSERALALLMEALDLGRRHALPDGELRAHRGIGRVLWYRGEYVAAREHAVTGSLLAAQHGDTEAAIDFQRLQATIDTNRGDARGALALLEAALADAESLARPDLIAAVCFELGRTAIHASDYPRAVESLERAIEVYEARGNVERVAGAQNNLGAACYFLSEWPRAREAWERFRRLCERLDERSELVSALNNLGSLYRELGLDDQALEVLERGAELAEETGRAHIAAMILGNRGEVLARLGDLANAEACYRRALSEFQRMDAGDDVLETERRLCELELARGKATTALDRTVDLARTARDSGNLLEEGHLHRVAAAALRLSGDLESADWFCRRALEILGGIRARYPLAQAELEAGELAAARGETPAARAHFEAAVETFARLGARWDLARARAQLRGLEAPEPLEGIGPGMAALVELSRSLGQLEPDVHLERLLETILEVTEFERGFVLLLDEEGRPRERTRVARGKPWSFERDEAQFSGSIVRRVAARSESVVITDIANEHDLRVQHSVVSLGLQRVMCAPMRARGRTIGIVYIDSRRLSTDDHGVHLPLLEALAAQAALAVENTRLLREERRRSELMAILAHEIRNPLSGILGYAELGLEEAAPNSEASDLFGRVRHDGLRLRRLVDNIMELSRQEAGKVDWSFGPVDVAALLADAAASYRVACAQKDIELAIDTEGLRQRALGNEDRLMQVVVNLLNNAIKFTPRGGRVLLRARTESVAHSDPDAPPVPATEIDAWAPLDPMQHPARELVRIDVTDTGHGMGTAQRQQLFEKFAQGETRRKSSGIGLGLYISREIVLHHGGSIWVDETSERGTTFSVRIPVA